MTLIDLDQIEARATAATPGPWYQGDPAKPYQMATEGYTTPDPLDRVSMDVFTYTATAEDAAFIVAARADVPLLVAEVRRLRHALTEAQRR